MGKYDKFDVGEKFITNEGYEIEIVEKNGGRRTIRFVDSKYEVKAYTSCISRGNIKNPYHKSLCGEGFIGVGNAPRSKDKKRCKEYSQWSSMIERCYRKGKHGEIFNKLYKDVEVCERWKCYNHFWEDIKDMEGFNKKDENGRCYELDKDIFGKREYNYKTSVFVPALINNFTTNVMACNGKYPPGITYELDGARVKPYKARISKYGKRKYIGRFNTEEEAYYEYCVERNNYAKELAVKYKGEIEERVYDYLMNYNEYDNTGHMLEKNKSVKNVTTG